MLPMARSVRSKVLVDDAWRLETDDRQQTPFWIRHSKLDRASADGVG
jgi:hypothetical protein